MTIRMPFEHPSAGDAGDVAATRARSRPWFIAAPRAPKLRSWPTARDGAPPPMARDGASPASTQPITPDASLLFSATSTLTPHRGLYDADFARAAATLGALPAAVQAVADVETSGNAFDERGRPRILFERHYFHRFTNGRYDGSHPAISAATPGGYGKFSEQYGKLEIAYGLDAEAALRSASWGRFQIMGDNHAAAGFASVRAFVAALVQSEAAHLDAFVAFVAANRPMAEALRTRDWASFARRYNGPAYAKNCYDAKLADACARYSKAA